MGGAVDAVTSAVSTIFGGGDMEQPDPTVVAPKVPSRDSGEVKDAARNERDRLRRGLGATILTGSTGLTDTDADVKKKKLLGQ